jgi:hypothetical protein
MAKKEIPRWLGRHEVIDDADHQDLEARAAIFEFRHGLPRDTAERQAHASYIKEKALDAACHHLLGIRAAAACGHDSAAEQHGHAYASALAAAGHPPLGPVPAEVLDRIKATKPQVYSFKAHPADDLIEPVGTEADEEDDKLRGFLEKLNSLKTEASKA